MGEKRIDQAAILIEQALIFCLKKHDVTAAEKSFVDRSEQRLDGHEMKVR